MVPGKGNRTQARAELEASLTISGVTCWLTVERRSGRRIKETCWTSGRRSGWAVLQVMNENLESTWNGMGGHWVILSRGVLENWS